MTTSTTSFWADWRGRAAEGWAAALALFISLGATGVAFDRCSMPVTDFRDRAVGMAIVMGVDPHARTAIYVGLLLFAATVFLGVYMGATLLSALASRSHPRLRLGPEKAAVRLLALTGSLLIVLHLLLHENSYQQSILLVGLLLVCTLAAMTVRAALAWFRPGRPHGLLADRGALVAILIVASQVTLAACEFRGRPAPLQLPFLLGAAALAAIGALKYTLLQWLERRRGGSRRRLSRAFVLGGLPLAFAPAAMPLGNEIQYTLSRHGVLVAPQVPSLALLALLALAGLLAFRSALRGRGPTARAALRSGYFPALLVSQALLWQYAPFVDFPAFDTYHTGEFTVPVQQTLQFGAVPYVDYQPPHGLFDLFPQLLYAVINRSTGPDMLAWGNGTMGGWLMLIPAFWLIYALLARLGGPLFAVLFCTFLPSRFLVDNYYAPLFIPALLLPWTLRRPRWGRLLVFAFTILGLGLWRVDFGVVAAAGAAAVFAAAWWTRTGGLRLLPLLGAAATAALTAAALLGAACLARGASLPDVLRTSARYFAVQNPTASYVGIITTFNTDALLQYILLPGVGLLLLAAAAHRLLVRRLPLSPQRMALFFLAVASLVMSIRSVQRHSLFEGTFNPYLFLLLLGALPFFFGRAGRAGTAAALLAVFAGYSLLRLPPRDYPSPARGAQPPFTFHAWAPGESRARVTDHGHVGLAAFMAGALQPGQTFFDLASAPMLYYFCGVRVPVPILEETYYTSEAIQADTLARVRSLREAGRLPFVVFRQNNVMDWLDFVPAEVRSYRMTEFVYRHYRPFLNINRYELWIDRDHPGAARPPAPEQPAEWAPLPLRGPAAAGPVTLAREAAGVTGWADVSALPPLAPEAPAVLRLTLSASARGGAVLGCAVNGQPFAVSDVEHFVLHRSTPEQPQQVVLPLRAAGGAGRVTDLQLRTTYDVTVRILRAEVGRLPPGAVPAEPRVWSEVEPDYAQSFDLYDLPRVWGSHDRLNPTAHAPVQADWSGPVSGAAGPWLLPVPAGVDKSAGNYLHLRLQSDVPASATVACERGPTGSFTFKVQPGPAADYLLRLSTQWAWAGGEVTELRVSADPGARLEKARLLQGD